MRKITKTAKTLRLKSFYLLPLFAFTIMFTSCKNDKKEEQIKIHEEVVNSEDAKKLDAAEQMERDLQRKKEEQESQIQNDFEDNQEQSATESLDSYPISSIDHAPIYPGCEDNVDNAEDCLSEQIDKYVTRHFKKAIALEEGLSGTQHIMVSFEISEKGEVKNVEAKADNPRLEQEAKRVISKLPKMTPGILNGKEITTQYAVPIRFEID